MIVIFDLDMTLVNTSSLETFRSKGQWSKVDSELYLTSLYPGVTNLISYLKESTIETWGSYIVTSSIRG